MWATIIDLIAATSPTLFATLNPGADPDQMAALERRIAADLPKAFTDYLRLLNGQNDLGSERPLYDLYRFLPANEITDMMDMMDGLFGDEGPIDHVTPNMVQAALWDPLWIPLAEFEGSPRLILDMHPGPNGRQGQVLHWFPGVDLEGEDIVIGTDFMTVSAAVLASLRSPPAG